MKKASRFLKQLFSAIVAAVRERSTAVRAKTSAARTRLIVLGILRNKKLLMSAINSKIHAIMGGGQGHAGAGGSRARDSSVSEHGNGHHLVAGGGGRKAAALLQSLPSFVLEQEKRAVVLLSSLPSFALGRDGGGSDSPMVGGNDKEDQELEKEEGGQGGKQLQLQLAATNAAPGSVIELARGAAEQGGAEFRLEDEIDHVADVFIRRFHDQMKLQKLDSFKRFCEMLERN